MDYLGYFNGIGRHYLTIQRVGPGRSIMDGFLWRWLDIKSTFEKGDLDFFSPEDKLEMESRELVPSFDHDSVSFCDELATTLRDAIANDKEAFENNCSYFSATKRDHFYRMWEYAKAHTSNGLPIIKEIDHQCDSLHKASEYGHNKCIRTLLRNGADVNEISNNGWSPLHYAVGKGKDKNEAIMILLKYGADVNQLSGCGDTPLLLATNGNHYEYIMTLLDYGANINIKDATGRSPFSLLSCIKCAKFLLKHGATNCIINDPDNNGMISLTLEII